MPGMSKAKGVSSNDFLSSCIIILHFLKTSKDVCGFVAFSRHMLTTDCGSRMRGGGGEEYSEGGGSSV